MGMDPLTLGLTLGGVSAAGSLLSGIGQSQQQIANAKSQQAQAQALRDSARQQADASQVELENIDRQRAQMRRSYEHIKGSNAVSLGAGNVDLSSGSALDVAEGNLNQYASDIGENAYTRALREWESKTRLAQTNWEADNLESNARAMKRQANNIVPTLLQTGLSGINGFLSGYSWGGKLNPFGKSETRYWDRALQDFTKSNPKH